MREVKILRRLVHPHIIRLLEAIETKSRIYVVMEYMDHGELFDYIMQKRKIEENQARLFFQQIISGIEFCHLNMVVHRDLKPENLLLDSNHNIKIADFGFSNFMRDGHFLKTSCGSPNYAAPEIVSGQPYAGPEVDVWSCGVILYALLCGELPFDADNIFTLFKRIRNGVYTLPNHLSFGARDMIHRILVVDPMKRITIAEICRHPWFQNHLPRHLVTPAVEAIEGETKECMYASPHMGDPMSSITVHNLQKERYMGQQVFPRRQDSMDNRKWMLGLQFQGTPKEIMTEVLRAFQRMNVCWKFFGPFSVRCRWLPISPTQMNGTSSDEPAALANYGASSSSDNALKFEMQLYRGLDSGYQVDLLRITGPPFLFLEICAALMSQFCVV
ncbi:hypothetical protein MRB53_009806 [Persea americana]|uniref:Uncharacterized protein n=1 Tax=Persea americana TaxID=3435 RepID=A0ACC2LQ32_PERAE|nr:hypothetical protein MRB53_009806 [Persea americana]